MAKRAFPPPRVSLASDSSLILNPDVPIEEEMIPDYNHKVFYPVNSGDVFHDRYKIVAKVAWGTCSTVWLARDLNLERQAGCHVILKVDNCDYSDKESAEHELKISRHLAAANPSHNGFPLVRTIIDSFEVIGPDGTHICLVYEPMRESLRLFRQHFTDSRLPLPLLKRREESLSCLRTQDATMVARR